jgi:hypothetical protein
MENNAAVSQTAVIPAKAGISFFWRAWMRFLPERAPCKGCKTAIAFERPAEPSIGVRTSVLSEKFVE